jgi:hypothetical protein
LVSPVLLLLSNLVDRVLLLSLATDKLMSINRLRYIYNMFVGLIMSDTGRLCDSIKDEGQDSPEVEITGIFFGNIRS